MAGGTGLTISSLSLDLSKLYGSSDSSMLSTKGGQGIVGFGTNSPRSLQWLPHSGSHWLRSLHLVEVELGDRKPQSDLELKVREEVVEGDH